jgi:hypothetical protein
MAAFATVTWQEDDEVTSDKLSQMSQNDTWLKDNLILGNFSAPPNALGTIAEGRTATREPITKMEAIAFAFDSQVPVYNHDFDVPLPPVFTAAPIIAISYNVENFYSVLHTHSITPNKVHCTISNRDGLTTRIQGVVRIIAVGK